MSDSSSHAAQPSESDFHDSHPLNSESKDESTPSIGDLSAIETSIDAPNPETPSVGDTSGIEDSSESEILGDITLLDEAFAEMNEDNGSSDTDIPVLKDSIEAPSESRILPPDSENPSVPLLDQEATVFAEMLKPGTDSTPVSTHTLTTEAETQNQSLTQAGDNSDMSDTPLFDSADAENNPNINELNSSLAQAAELLNETPSSPIDNAEKTASEITGDAALAALLDENTEDEIVPPESAPETRPAVNAENLTSIDEKIALASAESEMITAESEPDFEDSEISILEKPVTAMQIDASEPSEFSASFAEELVSPPIGNDSILDDNPSTEISEFNPDVDLNNAAVTEASHSVGIMSQNQAGNENPNKLNLSIPFELHAQLSNKIDELVIQATSSITEELHLQLSSKLENLLENAVESVLPKLVNQMASELRTDINSRVKQQLPNIINDVLNKTRLQK